jgi:hypothetical protein
MTKCYTYDSASKQLKPVDNPADIDGVMTVNPSPELYARIDAYPLGPIPVPEPREGKYAVPDGYELIDGEWVQQWRYDDAPTPTIADFDAAMEDHLRAEREARGYTTREPDAYLNSVVPRWKRDAEDWVAHRDAVMLYALELMNAVAAGTRQPPTMEEFVTGLPSIAWSFAE